jgi:hypothetical protein
MKSRIGLQTLRVAALAATLAAGGASAQETFKVGIVSFL